MNIDYQAAYDYLVKHGLAFCFTPHGMITLDQCVKELSEKTDLTFTQVLSEMEELNI